MRPRAMDSAARRNSDRCGVSDIEAVAPRSQSRLTAARPFLRFTGLGRDSRPATLMGRAGIEEQGDQD